MRLRPGRPLRTASAIAAGLAHGPSLEVARPSRLDRPICARVRARDIPCLRSPRRQRDTPAATSSSASALTAEARQRVVVR
jgi:hypothetical protein